MGLLRLLRLLVFGLASLASTNAHFTTDCRFNVSSPSGQALFDLSVLPHSWVSASDKDFVLHFNLCPRIKESPCHSKDSLVCAIDRTNSSNQHEIGATFKNITHFDEYLSVELSGSKECKNGKFYSTVFLLICSQETEEIPSVLSRTDECVFEVRWVTLAGCPVKEMTINNSCIWVAQNNSYDLRALYRPSGFKAVFDGDQYLISVCGPLKTSICPGEDISVCRVSGDGSYTSIAQFNSSQLISGTHTPLTLVYHSATSTEPLQVQILFSCESGLLEPVLKPALGSTLRVIKFEMRTGIVCQPSETSCEVNDPVTNYKYDLNSLSKYVQNVEARLANREVLLFNLCKSLIYQEGRYCTGGNVMGCLTNGTSFEVLATSHKPPVVEGDHLSVQFEGGKMCNGSSSRLQVNLYCSSDSAAHAVKVDDCSYKVEWNATAACPLKVSQGHKCLLTESFNGQLLDFNSLNNPTGDYVLERSNNESYRVNLCRPLSRPCNGQLDVSVCWKEGDVERAIGKFSDSPTFSNGQMSFVMEGEPCSDKSKKSVVTIIMPCDYDAVNSKPEMGSRVIKDFHCQFYFLWKSSKACTDRNQFNCTLQTPSHFYDLRPLVNTKGNYEVKYHDSTLYINVCHSIVLGHWVSCGASMGACLVNRTVTDPNGRKTDLGLVTPDNKLILQDGNISLTYHHGNVCQTSQESSYSTTITFICSPNKTFTYPKFSRLDGCHYYLVWETAYACPQSLDSPVLPLAPPLPPPPAHQPRPTPTINCSVDVPNSDITIDLKGLSGRDWAVEDHEMWLSVCGPLKTQNCIEGSGLCRRGQGLTYTGMGAANDRLFLSHNALTLNYTDDLGQTVITEFMCAFRNAGPLLIKDIDHSLVLLSFPTPLACMYHVDKFCCGETRGPLCHLSGVYPVRIPPTNQTLYLSICKELELDGVSYCHGTAGACLVSQHGHNEKNVGYPTIPPVVRKSGSITLLYTHGDDCPESGLKYSTRVNFVCDPGKLMGSPVFLNLTHDCEYQLEWRTSLVCQGREEGEATHVSACLKEDTRGFPQILFSHSAQPLKVSVGGVDYSVSLCHKRTPPCPTDICYHGNVPFAQFSTITYRRVKNATIFFFKYTPSGDHPMLPVHQAECGADVRVICNKTDSNPKGMMINRCKLKVVWETPLGCEPHNDDTQEEHAQESHSFKVWIIVSVLVASITGIVFWISLRRRNGVMGFFNGRVSYSRGFYGERAKLDSSSEWLHES